MTAPEMTADEFRDALAGLGYSQEGFALAIGYGPRAGQRWAAGDARIPGPVVIIIRLLQARPELASVLAEIAPMERAKIRPTRVKSLLQDTSI